jgi:hypothetical protein
MRMRSACCLSVALMGAHVAEGRIAPALADGREEVGAALDSLVHDASERQWVDWSRSGTDLRMRNGVAVHVAVDTSNGFRVAGSVFSEGRVEARIVSKAGLRGLRSDEAFTRNTEALRLISIRSALSRQSTLNRPDTIVFVWLLASGSGAPHELWIFRARGGVLEAVPGGVQEGEEFDLVRPVGGVEFALAKRPFDVGFDLEPRYAYTPGMTVDERYRLVGGKCVRIESRPVDDPAFALIRVVESARGLHAWPLSDIQVSNELSRWFARLRAPILYDGTLSRDHRSGQFEVMTGGDTTRIVIGRMATGKRWQVTRMPARSR